MPWRRYKSVWNGERERERESERERLYQLLGDLRYLSCPPLSSPLNVL